MSDNEQILPKIETVRDPDFKVIYAEGIVGDLNPERGLLTFYYDIPELETDPKGVMSVKNIERHLAVDIRVSPEKWVMIARWMIQHADYYEKWKSEQLKKIKK